MKIGYARVSTKDQSFHGQTDALEAAGCKKIFKEVASGAKAQRSVLQEALNYLREGDTLVIWKLDRLGRTLRELVELVNTLSERNIGLTSLNDPVDTTTSQGKFVFSIFAALAEFERNLIRERTKSGLEAARARGRKGGRPKGLSPNSRIKATAAAALYEEGKLSIKEICQQLDISKSTLYSYLSHRGIVVGKRNNPTAPKST